MKKWLISSICVVICILLIVGSINFLIDPLMQYRPLDQALTFVAYDYDYINPGYARNTDYDAVLVGTSLIENTDVDYYEKIFGKKMIKLIYPGGTPLNTKKILDVVYEKHNPSLVLCNIDDSLFFNSSDELSHELPEYLYDRLLLNDIGYLLNLSVLYNYSLKDVFNSARGLSTPPLLRGDAWGSSAAFGKNAVLRSFEFNAVPKNPRPEDYYQEKVSKNLNDNILPIITAHPETDFIFFFPPKCITYWKAAISSGVLHAKFFSGEYIIRTLLEQKNVRVFFFQDHMDWTTDFSLYKDNIHFIPGINSEIGNAIAKGEGELTLENYAQIMDETEKLFMTFDYDAYL